MTEERTSIHGQWSSKLAFILAATGCAVGLGNIWKFPYITGENGGGAFVIVYLVCIILMGLPVMMAEVLLGRRGKHSPINTMRYVAREEGASSAWQIVGWSGVVAGFLILSYYSVIAGWALAYIPIMAEGTFNAVQSLGSPDAVKQFAQDNFVTLISNPGALIGWHTVFMVVTMIMVAGGVKGGLEKAVQFMMPALFLLLLVLLGYAISTGDYFITGVEFLFKVDFKALFYPNCTPDSCEFSGRGILVAMGQAFFTLSLGMGSIMVYGAYLSQKTSIAKTIAVVVAADTTVAILAGLVIFPIVFSNQLAPGAGPGLVFQTLPIAFGQMPWGAFFGTLFFILLAFAAWSSSISLLEPVVSWLVEATSFSRKVICIFAGAFTWLIGLITVFSFNIWSDIKPLSHFAMFKNSTLFDLLDFLTANIMLPLGGLAMAIFVAWIMRSEIVTRELKTTQNNFLYQVWLFALRFITPLGVGLVFLNAIGVFS